MSLEDVFAKVIVALARRLTDLGEGQAMKDIVAEILDPAYLDLRDRDQMLRVLALIDEISHRS